MKKNNFAHTSSFGKNVTRKQLQEQFAAETFLTASFFKMKTLGSPDPKSEHFCPKLDKKINDESGSIVPMANTLVTERFIPKRDTMPKFPKGVVSDSNRGNDGLKT